MLALFLAQPLKTVHDMIFLCYEPLPPVLGNTPLSYLGFSKPCYMYPWFGAYLWYAGHHRFGWYNMLTTGLFSRFLVNVWERTGRIAICEYFNREYRMPPERNRSECEILESVDWRQFFFLYSQYTLSKVYGIVLTHPFVVISYRQVMALIGDDMHYRWFPQAFCSVYRENGVRGYFQGLMPRLIAETAASTMFILFCRCVRPFVRKLFHHTAEEGQPETDGTKSMMEIIRFFSRLLISQLLIVFRVTTAVMAVHNARLKAVSTTCGGPYSSWRECHAILKARDHDFIWRRHVPPPLPSTAESSD